MSSRSTVFLALAAVGCAFAAETAAQLQSPVLGWVSAGTQIRAVLGVPGAVVLGEPIALPDSLGKVVIAPALGVAIAERAAGSEAVLVRLSRAGVSDPVSISGTMARFDRAVFSASGRTVALLSGTQVNVISGLASDPALSYSLELRDSLDAPITALAVRDNGQIAVGTSDGTSGSVWLISGTEAPRRAATASVPSALAFHSDTGALLVGDKGSKQVSLLGPEYKLLAGEAQGIVAPAALQASGQTLWIADAGANSLMQLDLNSGALATSQSSYAPASLLRTDNNGAFLVGSSDGNTAGVWTPGSKSNELWRLPLTGQVE